MELNITCMLEEDIYSYSNSVFRSGREDIGRVTWNNALKSEVSFVTDDNVEEIKDYIKEFGAWTEEEIAKWDNNETNALVIQFISGDLQEYLEAKEGDDFEKWNENFGGRVYECDIEDHENFGELFYYIGM